MVACAFEDVGEVFVGYMPVHDFSQVFLSESRLLFGDQIEDGDGIFADGSDAFTVCCSVFVGAEYEFAAP